MCKRDDCPKCGAAAKEPCLNEPKAECIRELAECPKCGAAAVEPCLEEAE